MTDCLIDCSSKVYTHRCIEALDKHYLGSIKHGAFAALYDEEITSWPAAV
jgi:hypothetical protein